MTNPASGSTIAITNAQHVVTFDSGYSELQYLSVDVSNTSGSSRYYADAGGFTGSAGGIFKNVSASFPNSFVVTTRNVADGTAAAVQGRINIRAKFRNGSTPQ